MRKTLKLVAIAVLFISTASAQTSAAQTVPFGDGESLHYTVSYRAALIPPINMMRVSLQTTAERFGGRAHFHVVGSGRTTGAAKGLMELNDTYHAWLDAKTLLPSRMTSDIAENDYRFRATYNYDWGAMSVANVRRRSTWSEDRRAVIPLTENSGDALSLFFRLRALDVAALSPGRSFPLRLVLDEDSKPITFRFVGREEIKIRRVGTFRALKFTCTMATSDGETFEEGMTFTVWVSDDDNRIPLLVDCPIRIGRVRATLADGFRTVHPMASMVE
ncbi:MAG: DUF3108 domain-containing protein [Alistipes sp.]|jgi:hypothetical protein|nr:DUF3108 domain-containing protein [Alistipes sp.]